MKKVMGPLTGALFKRKYTDRYVNEILMPVVLPYFAAHPGMALQQDNATPEYCSYYKNFLATEKCLTTAVHSITYWIHEKAM